MMVGFAASHTSGELRRLSGHLLEVVSPETADRFEAARLEREHAAAQRSRYLEFKNDGHGSILIRGSLPITAAEPLIRVVDSYAAAQKRAFDDVDPHAEYVSPPMQRADGLLAGAYVAWYGWVEYRAFQGDLITGGPVEWVSTASSRVGALIADAGPGLVAIAVVILGLAGAVALLKLRLQRDAARAAAEIED